MRYGRIMTPCRRRQARAGGRRASWPPSGPPPLRRGARQGLRRPRPLASASRSACRSTRRQEGAGAALSVRICEPQCTDLQDAKRGPPRPRPFAPARHYTCGIPVRNEAAHRPLRAPYWAAQGDGACGAFARGPGQGRGRERGCGARLPVEHAEAQPRCRGAGGNAAAALGCPRVPLPLRTA